MDIFHWFLYQISATFIWISIFGVSKSVHYVTARLSLQLQTDPLGEHIGLGQALPNLESTRNTNA